MLVLLGFNFVDLINIHWGCIVFLGPTTVSYKLELRTFYILAQF